MSDTLILNSDGLPLSTVPLSTLSWQESIKLMFLDRVSVLAEYEDWIVHSPSSELKVPSVMMLRDYVKVGKGVKFSRQNVFLRDNYQCQYCGLEARHNHNLLTLDHVVPRFSGGKTRWDNVVAACSPCNLEKAHFSKMKPKCGTPQRPTYYQLVAKSMTMPINVPDQSWVQFCGWPEELVTVTNRRRRSS